MALQSQSGQAINNQSALASALQAQMAGQGPNPAQSALAQNTGQNIASTASLLAGARGSSANVGLMSRQIGQAGAATQQNAVGQAATLGALSNNYLLNNNLETYQLIKLRRLQQQIML